MSSSHIFVTKEREKETITSEKVTEATINLIHNMLIKRKSHPS